MQPRSYAGAATQIDTRSLLTRVVLTLLLASVLFAVSSRAQESFSGQWMIERHSADSVQFTLRYSSDGYRNGGWWNSSWSTDTALAALQGLNTADLNSSAGTNVNFKLVRDAGTFDCTGWARNGDASGHWTFAASPTFAAELKKRGLSTPAPSEQFDMAMSDVTLGLVDELKSQGYQLDITDLVRAGKHGVSLEYVRGMKAAGYKFDDLDALTKMCDHGVTPKYVQEMASYGYKNLSAYDLRRMRDHGVTAEYLHGMDVAGFKNMSSDEVVRLRDHGVSPQYIGDMAKAGIKGLTTDEMTRMRDHGVSAEYVTGMVQAGYKDLTSSELMKLRDRGVGPEYVRDLAQAGLTNLAVTDLTRLRDHGVSAEYVRDLKSVGVSTKDPNQLTRMRDHAVTASFVREAKERGFPTTDPEELIRLRSRGFEAYGRSLY